MFATGANTVNYNVDRRAPSRLNDRFNLDRTAAFYQRIRRRDAPGPSYAGHQGVVITAADVRMHRRAPGAYDSQPGRGRRHREFEGGSVARAKHTGRAEARRRYRQATTEDAGDDGLEGAAPVVERGKAEPSRAARQSQSQGPARPGITSSFRAAYRPANLREDLAQLPT